MTFDVRENERKMSVYAGVFTLLCIPYGHPFWRFEEPKRSEELYIAFEHVALTGGLLLAAVASR
jgi:transmembrane protein